MNQIHGGTFAKVGSRPCTMPVSDATAIILLILFIGFVVSVPKFDLAGIIAFASVPLMLGIASKIPLRPILSRLVVVAPFILFMAAGNLFLDHTIALTFMGTSITGGMVSATVIAAKTVVTLSSLLMLMTCMPFQRFGMALTGLGVPEVFVTQLLLVYRYSFLLSEEAAMMQKARDLRAFNSRGKGVLVTAGLIGSLLIRTTSRAERIYMAMSARGFRTALASKPPLQLNTRDLLVLGCSLLLFIAFRIVF